MQLIQKAGPSKKKIDLRADGTHESHPTASELKIRFHQSFTLKTPRYAKT